MVTRRPERDSLPKAFTTSWKKQPARSGPDYCRSKFLRAFPDGFADKRYVEWERGYKLTAYHEWQEVLSKSTLERLIEQGGSSEVVARMLSIEGKTNLLFPYEKMALRDAARIRAVAELIARSLHSFLFGEGDLTVRFDKWCSVLASLPVKQSKVCTWPVATVFGFMASPDSHMFFKPNVTRAAAAAYGYPLEYNPKPSGRGYRDLLSFCSLIQSDLKDLAPADMIDVQSFIWVLGSDEYDDWK